MTDKRATRAQTRQAGTGNQPISPQSSSSGGKKTKGDPQRPLDVGFQYGIIYEYKGRKYTYPSLIEAIKIYQFLIDPSKDETARAAYIEAKKHEYKAEYDAEVEKDKTIRRLGRYASYERKVAKQQLDDATSMMNKTGDIPGMMKAWKEAEWELGDFLYFQNIIHRKDRLATSQDLGSDNLPLPGAGRQKMFGLSHEDPKDKMGSWMGGIINHYDFYEVGELLKKHPRGPRRPDGLCMANAKATHTCRRASFVETSFKKTP